MSSIGCTRCVLATAKLVAALALVSSAALAETELVPGTAVLANQGSSDSSGNGGNINVASSNTNIFTPAAFVDYKRFGGEPSVLVDRYPFQPGQFGCPGAPNVTPCPPRDIIYQSAPNGFVFPQWTEFSQVAAVPDLRTRADRGRRRWR
jgi:hypothetical protein